MTGTPDILKAILRRKAAEVVERSQALPLRELSARVEQAPETRDFVGALENRIAEGRPAVIAEIKKASPSRGVIREDYDPGAIAASYQRGGATCLSVLTDRDFFQGDDAHLRAARVSCTLPILRKDFIVDAYQIYEARVLGADCILLIVAALGDAQLLEFSGLAAHLDLGVLVEVHDQEELDRALALDVRLIGINNRDLRSFETRIDTTLNLLTLVPEDRLLVTESGIHSRVEVQQLREAGVHAFLVGESLMRAPDPAAGLKQLFG